MEFGMVAGPALPARADMSSKAAFDYAIRMCDVAHASGFHCIGLSNKYLSGPVHQFMQPMAAAGYILGRYPGMYVMTNVFLLPYENPVAVAETVATLDMIAPGKFLFGVGQGYRADEGVAFDIPNNERGRRTTEAIKALKLLWQEAPATFNGEFYRFENADIGMKPVNGKGPPIIMAADKVISVAKIPERGGDYWIPSARHSKPFLREALPVFREALAKAGKPWTGLPLIRDIAVAESAEAADALVRQSITDYLHRQSKWGQPGEDYSVSFDELKEQRIILGNSEQAAEELISLRREFDAKFVTFRIYTPGMDLERALDVVRQIGEEVIPMVQKEVGKDSMFA